MRQLAISNADPKALDCTTSLNAADRLDLVHRTMPGVVQALRLLDGPAALQYILYEPDAVRLEIEDTCQYTAVLAACLVAEGHLPALLRGLAVATADQSDALQSKESLHATYMVISWVVSQLRCIHLCSVAIGSLYASITQFVVKFAKALVLAGELPGAGNAGSISNAIELLSDLYGKAPADCQRAWMGPIGPADFTPASGGLESLCFASSIACLRPRSPKYDCAPLNSLALTVARSLTICCHPS